MNADAHDDKFKHVLQQLDVFHQKDFSFSTGRILGSMCACPHPIAKKAYVKFLETNLGDPGLFPGSKEMESLLIAFIAELLHAPDTALGHVVSGGTEGNITAIWLAKQLSKKREIVIPESAHFSFQKISSLMDVKLVPIPLDAHYVMDVNVVKKKITSQTAAVVGVAGSTDLGTIDPIPELSDICTDEQIFLHVDAAFGGFVIPFLKELQYRHIPDFDFSLTGVSTVSIDSHKMGCSAIPLGTLVIRDKQWLEEISVESQCISSKKQAGILGTRSGGPVAAAYAVSQYLGYEGYKEIVKTCMETTDYAVERITEIGLPLVMKPTMNVLAVKLKNLTKIVDRLSAKGWKVNKMMHLSSIRIVIMPQITKKIIDEFIPVLKKTCEEVGEL